VILSPWRPESVAGSAQHFIGATFQDCGGVGFTSLSVVEPQCPTTSRSYSRYHLPIHNRIGLSLIWRAQLNGDVGGKSGRQDRRCTDATEPGKPAAYASNDAVVANSAEARTRVTSAVISSGDRPCSG